MQDAFVGRVLRALRHRKGWRQADLSHAASVSRAVIASLEAGELERHTLGALRRAVQAAGGTLQLSIFVPGGDVQRLLDADHVRLQAQWKSMLERYGWIVEAEATFSVYGERGSVDLLAWHPETRTLLIIEIKTVIVEVGALLATLDRKTRLARSMARDRGWATASVVPALVVLEGSTARRRIAESAALFSRFGLRGRPAISWVADPAGAVGAPPSGVLVLSTLSDAHRGDRRRAGRQRIRPPRPDSRSTLPSGGPADSSKPV